MKKIILLLWLGFILHSCANEPQIENEMGNIEDITISFDLELPNTSLPTTRAGGAVAKDVKIEDITILVFDEFSKCKYGRTGKITQSSSGDAKFTSNLLASDTPVTIYVFANVKGGVSLTNYINLAESDVIKGLTTNIDLNGVSTTALPMHGKLYLANIDNTTTTGNSVSLLRSVASVDVVVTANNFTLQEITAYFTPNEGRLVYDVANWDAGGNGGNGTVTRPTIPENIIITTKTQTANKVVENAIKNQIFIYENINKKGTGKSTRVVVKGEYNDGTSTKSYWYPVDFVQADGSTLSNVLRNFRYNFNIASVTGKGYDSEEDASIGSSQNIKVTLIPWDEETSGEIIFDGENYFSIESKSVKLYGHVGVKKYIKVKSNIDVSKWEMRWGETGDYTIAQEVSSTYFSVKKPNTASNSGYLLFTTLLLHGGVDKKETLNIKVAKRLNITIKVVQSVKHAVLEVDGQNGASGPIETTLIRYEGGVSQEFEVVTGDDMVLWSAKLKVDNSYMKFPTAGLNDGSFRVIFNPYLIVGNDVHTAEVILKRDIGDVPPVVPVPDVVLKFTQESQPDFSIKMPYTVKAGDPTVSLDMIPLGSHKDDYEWTATVSDIDVVGEIILQVSNDNSSWHESVSGIAGNTLYVRAPKRNMDGSEDKVTLTINFNRKNSDRIVHSTIKSVDVTSDWIYKVGDLYPNNADLGNEEGLVVVASPLRILERVKTYGSFIDAEVKCGNTDASRLPYESEVRALCATIKYPEPESVSVSVYTMYMFSSFQFMYGDDVNSDYAYKFLKGPLFKRSYGYNPDDPTTLNYRCTRTIVE